MFFEDARDSEEADEGFQEDEPEVEWLEGDPLKCRCIKIGSHKIVPFRNSRHLLVHLYTPFIIFPAQLLHSLNEVSFCLRSRHITSILAHFGELLPVIFIFITEHHGIRMSMVLNAESPEENDPESTNVDIPMLTFLLDTITSEQINFFRNCFLGGGKVQEIDHTVANEILIRTTVD